MARLGSKARRVVRPSVKVSEKLVRLRPKGQVTVPAKQLGLLGLRAGDQLLACVEGDRIVLRPAQVGRRSPPRETAAALPTRAQLSERRRVLATLRPLSARDLEELEPVALLGAAFTDVELEAAIAEGRE